MILMITHRLQVISILFCGTGHPIVIIDKIILKLNFCRRILSKESLDLLFKFQSSEGGRGQE